MLKISKLSDYAVRMACLLANQTDRRVTASWIACELNMSLPTVSKLLGLLKKAGLLSATQGALGGYRLAVVPQEITLASLLAAVEGPPGLTECVQESGHCVHESNCHMRSHWHNIHDRVWRFLDQITLAELLLDQLPVAVPLSTGLTRGQVHVE